MNSFINLFARLFFSTAIAISIVYFIGVKVNINLIESNFQNDMKEMWSVLNELNLQNDDFETLNKHLTAIGKDTNSRITIISPSGKVLSDTATPYDKLYTLQNHSNREEVVIALQGSSSFSNRASATTGESSVYYAKRGNDGNVLRLSYNSTALSDEINEHRTNAYTVYTFIMLLLAAICAYYARKVSYPIKSLNELSQKILSGDTDSLSFPDFKDAAIDNISSAIYSMHKNYTAQEAGLSVEKQKITAMFSAMKEGIMLLDDNSNIVFMNDNAKKQLNNNIDIGTNVLSDTSDIDMILFFKNILSDSVADKKRVKLKERIYDLYSKTIVDNTLIVFDEVTESAQYEAFKSELVGNITHEIKTPLALMLGASETIMNDPDMDQETRNKFLGSIFRNSKELNNLINETLDLHKLEGELGTITVDNAANLQSVIEDAEIMIADKNGKNIIFDVPNSDVMIRSEHLLSVISNLVNNAIKYSKGDNIHVSIEHANDNVKISVADEGPAIPEHEQQRIFERFYTVSKARTRGRSGSGIGLAIVKHIARQYIGSATVSTNANKGNTFEVTLFEKI